MEWACVHTHAAERRWTDSAFEACRGVCSERRAGVESRLVFEVNLSVGCVRFALAHERRSRFCPHVRLRPLQHLHPTRADRTQRSREGEGERRYSEMPCAQERERERESAPLPSLPPSSPCTRAVVGHPRPVNHPTQPNAGPIQSKPKIKTMPTPPFKVGCATAEPVLSRLALGSKKDWERPTAAMESRKQFPLLQLTPVCFAREIVRPQETSQRNRKVFVHFRRKKGGKRRNGRRKERRV